MQMDVAGAQQHLQWVSSAHVCVRFSWTVFTMCLGLCLTCFSGVWRGGSPAAGDVDVQDIHRCHGEGRVAQPAAPEHRDA